MTEGSISAGVRSCSAWQKFGGGETPASSGKKGDHLVGDYYVAFDKAYKAEIKELMAGAHLDQETAEKEAPIIREAQAMRLPRMGGPRRGGLLRCGKR